MPALERITPANALTFKAARLQALQDSPSAFGSTYAKESQFSDAHWLKRAADWSNENSVGYLAMDSGTGCGIAAAFLNERDPFIATLISMWVSPSHRRSGIGRALIEAINVWARDRGAHTLRLTVTSNNKTAIDFYTRNQFSMTAKTEPYPNDPALVEYEMSRPVAAR